MKAKPKVGVGFRRPLAGWLNQRVPQVECLEVTAEHFFDAAGRRLEVLAANYPIYVHGLGLSLGTPGPLDIEVLEAFAAIAERANAVWVSEHVAFTRAGGIDLGHLNPLLRTEETLGVLAAHVAQLKMRCGRPVMLENITTRLDPGGDLSEPEFLNQLCGRAGCRLLLDVTNLFINASNLGFDAEDWLSGIEPRNIGQLHIVGYSENGGRLHDHHCAPIQDDLLKLLGRVIDYAPVEAVILERDEDLGETGPIIDELEKLHDRVKHWDPIEHETAG